MTDHIAKVILVVKLQVWLEAPKEVRSLGDDAYIYSHRDSAHLVLEGREWDPGNLGPGVGHWIYENKESLMLRVHYYDDPSNTSADCGTWEDCPVVFVREAIPTLDYATRQDAWSEVICGHVFTESVEDGENYPRNAALGVSISDDLTMGGMYTCKARNLYYIEVGDGAGSTKESALLDLIENLKNTRDQLSERIRLLEHK
jgi:hypothetical protein